MKTRQVVSFLQRDCFVNGLSHGWMRSNIQTMSGVCCCYCKMFRMFLIEGMRDISDSDREPHAVCLPSA